MPTTTEYTSCTDCCPADTIETDCCENAIPADLNGSANPGTNGCGCTTVTFTATHTSGQTWHGEGTFENCSETFEFDLSCESGTWWVRNATICGVAVVDQNPSVTCDPFEATFSLDSVDACPCGFQINAAITLTA